MRRQGRGTDVLGHEAPPRAIDQDAAQRRDGHAQAGRAAGVGVALALVAVHAPQLRAPLQAQRHGTAVVGDRAVVQETAILIQLYVSLLYSVIITESIYFELNIM